MTQLCYLFNSNNIVIARFVKKLKLQQSWTTFLKISWQFWNIWLYDQRQRKILSQAKKSPEVKPDNK